MTAAQMKRIQAKLERARVLAHEAHELARAGHGDYSLRELTARAADDMTSAQRALQALGIRDAIDAEAIARSLEDRCPDCGSAEWAGVRCHGDGHPDDDGTDHEPSPDPNWMNP
jgi:hypothetical protein